MEEKRVRRESQDSVAQAFRKFALAENAARIGELITGDAHDVESRRSDWHIVIRTTPEGKRFPV